MLRLSGIAGVNVLILLLFPVSVFAGTMPDLSIGYTWGTTGITDGGVYELPLNTVRASTYTWPGGAAYGDIYKGTPANSTVVTGHAFGNRTSWTEFSDSFSLEGDYFVVVYNVPFWASNQWIYEVRDWFKSGTSTNPLAHPPINWGIIRFKVGVPEVELYTQTISNYPSLELTDAWNDEDYALGQGDGSCGTTIGSCGCALTSAVMVARFHKATTGIDGEDMNPLKANAWLQENNGYGPGGGVNWNAFAKYANYKIRFDTRSEESNNYALLDSFLTDKQPVIARADPGRGGSTQHFFVIDRKLATNYQVKDPYWYNTHSLDEAATDNVGKVRDYLGGFDALRVFTPHDGTPYASLTVALGSPAELLITDSEGRRLGKDPGTGEQYSEIPGGSYGSDDIDNPESTTIPDHRGKVASITLPSSGDYTIEVVGTGNGPYTLKTTFSDTSGNATSTTHVGDIEAGDSFEYLASFDTTNANNSEVIPPLIQKVPLTITAENKAITLGQAIPPLTAAIAGFAEGDTAAVLEGAPECTTEATGAAVGTFPITCTTSTLVSGKYEFTTFVPGALTISYQWSGFLQPIDDVSYNPSQTVSVFKTGSTIPVKFQLKSATGSPVQSIAAPLWLAPQKGAAMSAVVDEPVYSLPATTGSTYRYDAATQQYLYNWSTKGLQSGYWYKISAQLDDGKIYSVTVGLR